MVCVIAEQAPAMAMARFSASLLAYPQKLLQALQLRLKVHSTRYSTDSFVLEARGTDRLQAVSIKAGKRSRLIECDYLACGYGLVPNLELSSTFGCRIDDGKVLVDSYQRSSISNIFCAGEITGIAGVDSAIVQGSIAGLTAVGKSAQADRLIPERERWREFSHCLRGAFALRPELSKICRDDTIICRCEDVSHGELKQYSTWRSAKLQTRCGMGPCQGRICGPATTSLYGWTPGSLRPPLVPARLSSLMAQESTTLVS
jgi:NAD(P)H-nitrite reductase large subunit